jgi:hypothetical protein
MRKRSLAQIRVMKDANKEVTGLMAKNLCSGQKEEEEALQGVTQMEFNWGFQRYFCH